MLEKSIYMLPFIFANDLYSDMFGCLLSLQATRKKLLHQSNSLFRVRKIANMLILQQGLGEITVTSRWFQTLCNLRRS